MNKIFSSLFLLIILIFILWALSGWYFGASAEQAFKAYIQSNAENSAKQTFRLELLDYHKSIFGAKAKLKISSDIPVIAEKMGEIELIAKLLNGPLFITKNGVSMGSFRWFVAANEANFTEAKKENLRAIFPHLLPRLIIRTDFAKNVHYSSKFQTNLADINLQGMVNSETKNNSGKLLLQNFHYDFLPNQIFAEKININYHRLKRNTPAYKPGNTIVNIPVLQIKIDGLKQTLKLALDATSSISQTNGYLNGYSKIKLKRLAGKSVDSKKQSTKQGDKKIPVDKASFTVFLKGLSSEGFLRYSELEAELDNLKQQAQWSLQENGEFPEGQDQIWQLYNEIEEISQRLPSIILNQMLNENSRIQFKAESLNSSGKSELIGELKSIKVNTHKSNNGILKNQNEKFLIQKSLKKEGDGFNILLSKLQGKAQVKLDADLFLFLKNFSPIKQSEFKLLLKDSKLLMH